MNLFNELNINGELCFDVGANIGVKTEKFLSYGASVVCIEPQLFCNSVLETKFSTNEKVKIVKTALGSSIGSSSMFISDEHTLSTMSSDFMHETTKQRFKNTVWGKEETVDVSTLDNMINLYGLPKYCKIDVEGYEVEILKGLSNKIKYVSVEFVPELKQKTLECMDLINKIGDYEYNYIDGESEDFVFNEWIDSETMKNYLKSNNDYQNSFGDLYAKLK
jgi:FkbM family methyltransferase